MGKAIARSFALSGDLVIIIGRRADLLQRSATELNTDSRKPSGGRVEAIPADLGEPGAVSEVGRKIVSGIGTVDVLVNNAGGVDRRRSESLAEVADSWLRDFRTNVLTAVLLPEALRNNSRGLEVG